ncbi:MAG TPA: HNH endonuclease [Prolixibacteraceae bacterium]|nr:HNH endonuclease [Prolixibacteraceae bacterium]
MSRLLQNILTLNCAPTKYGKAPHKPVLLLAVIESFENGEITQNWISVNDSLLQRFYDLWKLLVKTENVPNFSLPFYHLKNEREAFWNLVTLPGKEIPTTNSKSIKSFRALTDTVLAAKLSDEMFQALLNPVEREVIKNAILEKYFGIKNQLEVKPEVRYSEIVKTEILYDPEANYSRKVIRQISEVPSEVREELIVLRSTIFRKAILEVYNNQCSVSGLKVEDENRNSLVDACHIMPFGETYNDSIKNGLALSPTFHRAFDRGLIAISDNYKVLVHPKLKDFKPESGIRQYENQCIILSSDERFYPSLFSLREHRHKFGYN